MGNTPAAVGVPVIDPDVERFSPAGSVPGVTDQEYDPVPPVAPRLVVG
jgi:hypothetical protein